MLSSALERILNSADVYAGIARGFVFVALALIVWAIFDRMARSAVGAMRQRCPRCTYSLSGLPVEAGVVLCPECGHESPSRYAGFLERLTFRPRWRSLAVGMVLLAGASFLWWWFLRPLPAPPALGSTPAGQSVYRFQPLPPGVLGNPN
jgi:hypothetical protein